MFAEADARHARPDPRGRAGDGRPLYLPYYELRIRALSMRYRCRTLMPAHA